jgi:hypothetical protein
LRGLDRTEHSVIMRKHPERHWQVKLKKNITKRKKITRIPG